MALLKELGFEDEAEFHRMVASVDLSTPEKLARFKGWQLVGLQRIIEEDSNG